MRGLLGSALLWMPLLERESAVREAWPVCGIGETCTLTCGLIERSIHLVFRLQEERPRVYAVLVPVPALARFTSLC